MNKQTELQLALENINLPDWHAQQIAEDAYALDEKIGDAMMWGIKTFGEEATTSVSEIKTTAAAEGITYFQAVARLSKK